MADRTEFGVFWPLLLLELGLAMAWGWTAAAGLGACRQSRRLCDRQTEQEAEAERTADRMKAVLLDLIDLAQKDADAQDIVVRYRIVFDLAPPLPDLRAGPKVLPENGVNP